MKNNKKYKIAIMSVFIWIGFVGAISFMEAWLKFRAPGITLPLGLGIGRLVFGALNKVELVLMMLIAIDILRHGMPQAKWKYFFIIPAIVLLVQTFWMLPELDQRAELHIQGAQVPPSNMHFYYVVCEFIKAICLLLFGINLIKNSNAE